MLYTVLCCILVYCVVLYTVLCCILCCVVCCVVLYTVLHSDSTAHNCTVYACVYTAALCNMIDVWVDAVGRVIKTKSHSALTRANITIIEM